MHKLLGILSALTGVFGALIIGPLLYVIISGGQTPANLAMHVLQLYGFLFSVFGLGLGLMSRFLAHRLAVKPISLTGGSIGLSMFSLMALVLGLTVS
jgi:hypothetical protein